MQELTQEAALKHIKHAWVAGVISGSMTLLLVAIAASGSTVVAELGVDWWILIDVVTVFGLSLGIYKKSRVCALLMFIYFVGSKIILWATCEEYPSQSCSATSSFKGFEGHSRTIH